MDWLAQNWIWIALAIGAFFLVSRAGGCGTGHSRHSHGDEKAAAAAKPAGKHRHGCC